MDIQAAIDLYAALDIEYLPLAERSKKPITDNWTEKKFTAEDFSPKSNIGILTGKRSNGFMDVDLDWAEAVEIAHHYMPPTQFIFGRESKPASHLGYRSRNGTTTLKYQVPGGGMILELRGDGGQTMAPGSYHPSGEQVTLVMGEAPSTYSYEELKRACGRAAAACVIARNMVHGIRHDLTIVVIGTLLRASWTAEMVQQFLQPILDLSRSGKDAQNIPREIERLDAKLKHKQGRLPGYTRLKQILGDAADSVCDWLGITKSEDYAPEVMSLRLLMSTEYPEPVWIIPGLLPEGITIIFGRPKSRKSFLALNLGLAAASGGMALGVKQTRQQDVLFLALEDSKRRIKDRALKLAADDVLPLDHFHLASTWDKGNVAAISDWLDEHSTVKLIIIDTWTLFRKMSADKNRTSYNAEYLEIQSLSTLCKERHIAVVLIGHARKSIFGLDQGDLTEMINGSMGISGSVDCIMGLYWTRGENTAVLHVTGRDVEEQQLAMEWDTTLMCWRVTGDAEDIQATVARQEVLDIIRDHTKCSVKQMASLTGKSYHSTRYLLEKLVQDGVIWKDTGAKNGSTYSLKCDEEEF